MPESGLTVYGRCDLMRTASELMAWTHLGKAMEFYAADRLELAHDAMALALNAGLHPGHMFDRQRAVDAELAARRDGVHMRVGEHLIVEAPETLLSRPGIVRLIAEAVLDISVIWSLRWGKPVLVTIFSSHDAVLFLHSRYGYYSERSETHKICLPPSVCRARSVLRQAVRHEAAHAAVHTLAGDAAPRWLDEGIAVWSEEPEGRDPDLRLAAMGEQVPTLQAIEASLGTYDVELDSTRAAIAYAAAGSFVGWLIEQVGVEGVRGVVAAIGHFGDTARTIRRTLRRDLRRLEREWRLTVAGGSEPA